MTRQNAALVEEINASIEQTESQAQQLDEIVDVFVVDKSDVEQLVQRNAAPSVKHRVVRAV